MRKIILLIGLITAMLSAFAQEQEPRQIKDTWHVNGDCIQLDSTISNIMVTYAVAPVGIRYVAVDYGQGVSEFYAYGKKSQIFDKWWKKIKFKSELQVVKFFETEGWEHLDTDITRDKNGKISYIQFKR